MFPGIRQAEDCAPIVPSRLDSLLVVTLVCSRRLFSVRSEQEGTGKGAFMDVAVRSFPKLLWHGSECIWVTHTRTDGGRNWSRIDRRVQN